MANNISAWNAKIDNTLTVNRLGRNGILYEYILPYGANPTHYYEDAIDVKSRKGYSEYDNGKRAGQYQPIGDKRYFNFYQMNKMTRQDFDNWYLEYLIKKCLNLFIEKLEEGGY